VVRKEPLRQGEVSAMSFDDYMRDIARIPLLTCDEEIILGTQVQEMMQVLRDNDIADQVSDTNFAESLKDLEPRLRRTVQKGLRARNRMISANMRLVVTLARKAQARQIHMTTQDLIQEGAIGLARAAEKFEPNRGYKFSTYAYWWIRQGITRAGESQEGMIKVPAHIQRTIRQAAEARIRLSAELMREPSFTEIAEAIGEENPEKIKLAIMHNPVIISLDFKLDNGRDSYTLVDVVNADDEAEIREKEKIAAKLDFVLMMVNALSESEQEIIKQRYGIGTEQLSVKEMAEQKGVTPQAIREKQQKITKKLKFVVNSFAMPAE
jgi:RNA polymerase sigma factor (sigma-70 family)